MKIMHVKVKSEFESQKGELKLFPLIVKKNRFTYHQLKRTGKNALYSQNLVWSSPPGTFEVFRVQKRTHQEMRLRTGRVKEFEATEKFPSN